MRPEKAKRYDGLETAQWNNGPLMGTKRYNVQYGPVSSRAFNGPRVMKGLIWAERHHGPYMGRKLQWAGIILDGPDEATGLNSDRP